jgi:hypothetical protein
VDFEEGSDSSSQVLVHGYNSSILLLYATITLAFFFFFFKS